MKNNIVFIVAILVLLAIGVAGYFLTQTSTTTDYETPDQAEPADVTETPDTTDTPDTAEPVAPEPAPDASSERGSESTLGTSAGGRDLTAYHFGSGPTELLFVGGLHGAYSYNTSLVAFEIIDYLDANPDAVPDNVTVTVLPVANPDGLADLTGTAGRFNPDSLPAAATDRVDGRFNANDVDLNRNFDCEWESEGTWQTRTVDGGDAPFSEPEAAAIRDYVLDSEPAAVVTYYSAAGGVYSSSCRNGILPETAALTNAYADATGYPAYEEFDFYEITGDMVNWLAKNEIPASVSSSPITRAPSGARTAPVS